MVFLEISQNSQQNTCRSNHLKCSMKKVILRNFTKFKGKHLCQSLFFNKVADLRPATSIKKRLWCRCFPVTFTKFLRTPFHRTPLDDCFCTCNFIKKETLVQVFSCEFCGISKNTFSYRTPQVVAS